MKYDAEIFIHYQQSTRFYREHLKAEGIDTERLPMTKHNVPLDEDSPRHIISRVYYALAVQMLYHSVITKQD